MKGVITKVWPKNERGPGSVVFSDGAKFSTFSDALLRTAEGLIGQMAEYTTETKGRYTNLASIKGVAGGAEYQQAQQAPAASAPAPVVDLTMRKIGERVAAALESIAQSLATLTMPTVITTNNTLSAPPAPLTPTGELEQKQADLAEVVGADAAAAMFDALKRKFAKKPDALAAAVDNLLASHGLGAQPGGDA